MAKAEKKKMSFSDLEQHAIRWATFRLEDLKEIAENLEATKDVSEDDRFMINEDIADQVFYLEAFMLPLRHDEDTLIEWAKEFIDEYYQCSKSDYND